MEKLTKSTSFFLGMIIASVIAVACAAGGKRPDFKKYPVRSESKMAWEACKKSYNNGKTVITNRIGKLCSTYCDKKLKKSGKCKGDLKVKQKNFCKAEDFHFFEGNYIYLPEEYL